MAKTIFYSLLAVVRFGIFRIAFWPNSAGCCFELPHLAVTLVGDRHGEPSKQKVANANALLNDRRRCAQVKCSYNHACNMVTVALVVAMGRYCSHGRAEEVSSSFGHINDSKGRFSI